MVVAVLGLGSIGFRHARNLLRLGEATVGFDPDPERRERFAAAGGATASSRSEALEQASAVVIASPSGQHLADLEEAVAAGCHVFVEKPLAHTGQGIDPLLREAKRRKLVVFVGFNLRYHPCVEWAKEALAEGRLGKILWARLLCSSYLPDWRPDQDYRQGYAADPVTGGILFDDVHEFDLAMYLLGPANTVAAAARRTGALEIEAEDCADIILRHHHGVLSTLHMDFVSPTRQRVTEVVGTDGLVRIDISNRRFMEIGVDGIVLRDRSPSRPLEDDYRIEMSNFLDCTRGQSKPRCDGGEALSVLEQVLAARKLAKLPTA